MRVSMLIVVSTSGSGLSVLFKMMRIRVGEPPQSDNNEVVSFYLSYLIWTSRAEIFHVALETRCAKLTLCSIKLIIDNFCYTVATSAEVLGQLMTPNGSFHDVKDELVRTGKKE